MRMPSVGDARRQVPVAGRAAQPWDVEVGLFRIAAELGEQRLNVALRFLVMDEGRFQTIQVLGKLLDGHRMLRGARVQRREGLLDEPTRELAKGRDCRAR